MQIQHQIQIQKLQIQECEERIAHMPISPIIGEGGRVEGDSPTQSVTRRVGDGAQGKACGQVGTEVQVQVVQVVQVQVVQVVQQQY